MILFGQVLFAAYYKDLPQTITQPNGQVIQCFASGDEFFNYLHDKNGYVIIQSQDGYFYYGIEKGDNVVASVYRVNTVNPAKIGLKKNVRISDNAYKARVAEFYKTQNKSVRAPHEGVLNNLVVYIRFSDQTEFTNTRGAIDQKFNPPSTVSLRSYYDEVSYGKLKVISHHYPVCADSINLSYQDINPRAYYSPYNASTNPMGYPDNNTKTVREQTLLKNAINAISSQVPTTINIDGDNDGKVDNVCFLIRGNSDAWADLLWGHRWWMMSSNTLINGKAVYDYTFQPENQNDVQTLCHEMFHALGAPDLYHYSYDNFVTAGPWDIMESGFGHMGAFMKWKYSSNVWINTIPEITLSGAYTLHPITSVYNNSYKIKSPNSTSEYFVVEYRKKEGMYESSVPGSGLLIYRIDPSAGSGNASGPPDEVYVFRKGGTPTDNGNINAAFLSANVNRTQLNNYTNPYGFLQGGTLGGLNIYNITSADSTISFNIDINLSTVADFTANAFVQPNEQVTFSDITSGMPNQWQWLFSGGLPVTSTDQNPVVTYANPGNYSVTLIATGSNGIDTITKQNYITVGGSSAWIPQHTKFSFANRGIKNISILNANTAWTVAYDYNNPQNAIREYARTIDGGTTWKSGTINGINGFKVASVSSSGPTKAWICAYDPINGGGKILITPTSGDSWVIQSTATFAAPEGRPIFIRMVSSSTGVCVGNPNGGYFEIYTTTNSGALWNRVIQANIPNPLAGEKAIDGAYSAVGNTIWFATDKGRIYKSTDKGLTWNVTSTSFAAINKIVFKDANNGTMLCNTGTTALARTTDGGTTWTNFTPNGKFFAQDLAYLSGTASTWVSVSDEAGNSGSSYSIDDGDNWTQLDSGVAYTTVAFFNQNSGWAGSYNLDINNGGIYKWNNIFVGIEKNNMETKNEMMIFPNPAHDKIFITSNSKNTTIEFYNISGKIILKENLNTSQTIDISGLANSVYFVRIITNNQVKVEKIIKE